MPSSKYFEEVILAFGTKDIEENVEFSFQFLGEADEFQFVEVDCSCTQVKFDKETKTLNGVISLKTAQNYIEGMNAFNKYLPVYINDGEPIDIADENGVRIPNPKKDLERLQIAGFVHYKPS